MEEPVRVRHRDGIATVMLNRPQALNALNPELVGRLVAQLGSLRLHAETRAVVVTGAGRAFCAGGDLVWVHGDPRGPAAIHEVAALFHRAVAEIRGMEKPVIAAVNGVAAGGGFSLALACDFRVMAEDAVMRQAYTSAGLSIDGGGSFNLPRLVGLTRALEIAAFDEPIDAQRALDWGLATRVVAAGRAEAEAFALARSLMDRSLSSFAWSKRLLHSSFETAFEVQLEHELTGITTCAGLPDGREGIAAFAGKRRPTFGGHQA